MLHEFRTVGRSRVAAQSLVVMLAAAVGCSQPIEDVEAVAHTEALITSNPPVVISQLYGSGGNSGATYQFDYVELFNRSSSAVDLGTLSLQYASAAGTGNFGVTGQIAVLPAASLAPGKYFLVQLAGGMTGAPLPTADFVGPAVNASGTSGKFALVTGTTSLGCNGGSTACDATQEARIMDLVGYGTANYSEGSPTAVLSATLAAIRKSGGCDDTNNNAADFQVLAPAPRNGSTPAAPCGSVGDSAPSVASTVPADNASNVSTTAAVQITFSEPVNATEPWFTFNCNMSGAIAAAISGGPTTFTLTPPAALANSEVCTIVVSAAAIADADTMDPPDTMASNYTFKFTVATSATPLAVHTVQGAAHLSPYQNQTVNVGPAIVTALRSNGFYMQDPTPDADDATSEGIFVFTSSAPPAAAVVGARVTVLGTVQEFRPGCTPCSAGDSAFPNLTTTEIASPTVTVINAGNTLPAPVVLGQGPGQRAAPLQVICDDAPASVETGGAFDPANDGIDFYESLEGMRLQIDNPKVIDPTRTFSGNSLEIGVLARSDAGLRTPRGGIIIAQNDFNPERVFLGNAIVPSFPSVNIGDSFNGSVVGVLDYTFANYKLMVTQALPSVISGGLAQETTPLVATLASQLTVASMNVENLDPTDPASKFSDLAAIVVGRLKSPDIVALEEVQDDNGATTTGGTGCALTMSTFINAISAAGGPPYAYRQIDPVANANGGEPGGNIRVVLMFRTDRGLSFIARGSATATTANSVDTSTAGAPHLSLSPGLIDPTNSAFNNSRKPLAAEFVFRSRPLFVIGNHFNSKGGDDPLFGRFQPPVLSSETQRMQQATVLANFVDTLLDADNNARVVVLGDFNDFSFSAPLTKLQSVGLVDMVTTLPANERYTYVYQGNSQDLDHILVSPALSPLATYDVVHVNAEFAVQASDHEPAVVRFEFGDAPSIVMGADPNPVVAGGLFSFQVSATGTPAPTFSLTASPPGMTINPTTGAISWNANVAPGDYMFTVQASNSAGSVSKQFTVRVSAAVPALTPTAALLLMAALVGCFFVSRRSLRTAFGVLVAATVAAAAAPAQAAPPVAVDLSTYVRVGRFDLPEPTRSAHPPNSLLAQEASNVTYNWDRDTLFITGDGGTSVVQVSKTGQLIDSMTLAQGGSPQGTEFYDTEGLTYIGSNKFVFTEERYRQAVLFTYSAGSTLQRSATQTVKLGTTIGNVGLEGVSWDPSTNGFIFVKEKDPQSVFLTTIDFNAGTASNGSPTATSSTDLFNPALASLLDFSDVFALSNLPSLNSQPDFSHLLIISQESGQIINVDRAGNVSSRLTIVADPSSPLTVPDMTMEGVTMDRDGRLYVANESGGGDANHPQLWVYEPSAASNLPPTGVTLTNQVSSIPENTSVAAAVKVASISIADDGLGTNNITLSGPDAASFQVIGVGLFLKAGTVLNTSTKPTYNVTVNVDDSTVGNNPDATVNFVLTITAATGGTASLIISEVAAWASGNSATAADWFELTNVGTAAANITGYKMDDNSDLFGSAAAMSGINSIAPGESVIFIESTSATVGATFKSEWFGPNPPPNLQVGTYSGSGVGLSTGGDHVNVYDSTGALQANVKFGASPGGPSFPTFDNAAGLNNTDITTLSAVGINGAFNVANSTFAEVGSPGTIGPVAAPVITVVATDASASEVGSDPGTFRISRTGPTVNALTVNFTFATGAGQATSDDYAPMLTGVATILSGQTFVDITISPFADASATEGSETVTLILGDTGSYDVGSPGSATITIADGPGVAPAVPAVPPLALVFAMFGFALTGLRSVSRRRG